MDQIWLDAPCPAMRLWTTGDEATWQLNVAASAWGGARGVGEPWWQEVATCLSRLHSTGPLREGRLPDGRLRWRSLPMYTGWLVWMTPEPEDTDASGEGRPRGADEQALGPTAVLGPGGITLLARMSHELRTPLNAVLGFAQLIEHDGAAVPIRVQLERVARIRQAGEQLLTLIGDVLERLESNAAVEVRTQGRTPAAAAAPAAAPERALDVLYIEDNPVNVILVEELVAMRPSTHLRCAVNGLSGVALASEVKPDIVLVDMQLPDIDGFEVLRRLRADRALDRSAIIALSANGMGDDIALARAAGFDDYWTKPIQFRHFLDGLDAFARAR